MTHDELQQRRPLWAAMTQLFLDTEVRWDVPSIALACAQSPLTDEALERIFWGEVFPEAISNLLQPAGEWAALTLDEGALVRRANHFSIPWLSRRAHGGLVQQEWLAVRTIASWLRVLEPQAQVQTTRALTWLVRAALGASVGPLSPEELVVAHERWPALASVLEAMRVEGEDLPQRDCAARVTALLDEATKTRAAREKC